MGCTDGESIHDIPGAFESWDRDCRERRNAAFDAEEKGRGPFRVGDTAYYRDHAGTVSAGTVWQVEGGKDGDLTEVFWRDRDQAIWIRTASLWAEKPDWNLGQECVCGCTFGKHSESGCIKHQIHRFQAVDH